MSGIAYGKTITFFNEGLKKNILTSVKPEDVIVNICVCDLTETTYIEYVFREQEKFDQFIEESDWKNLPQVHHLGTKYFTSFEEGKFV